MKCFYHRADLDGKCSGAIVKLAHPDCELIGIDYGDPFPWERVADGEKVYMVDFGLQPFSDMQRLAATCGNLVWIDHHKTALDEATKANFMALGYRQVNQAGCELTWAWINGERTEYGVRSTPPLAVTLLGRYDVWDHSDPRTMPFQYGLRFIDPDPNDCAFWRELFEVTPDSESNGLFHRAMRDGKLIQQYSRQSHAGLCEYAAHEMDWENLHWIAMNGPYRSSQVFDSVYDPAKHDGMLIYCWNGKQWRFGMYSTKADVDVGAIAKKHGGGGHKGASGFQAKTLPFTLA